MQRYTKLVLISLTATAIMALAVGSASARNLSLNRIDFRVRWARLELSNTAGIGNTVGCPVTLEGTLHSRTLAKVERTLIGYVTRAFIGSPCTGGGGTIKSETLPWHLTYERFSGTLPNIGTITLLLVGVKFRINNESAECEGRTSVATPAAGIARRNTTTGQLTELEADPSRQIPLTGGFCGLARGFFRGTASVTDLPGTGLISVTLI